MIEEIRRQDILRIAEQFAAYDVRIFDQQNGFTINNPYGKHAILVESEGDAPDSSYIVCFTYYHTHLEMPEQVVAFVRDILEGERVAVVFLKDGKGCMSTELTARELQDVSYTMLAERMGFDGTPKPYGPRRHLIDIADSFHVRGWGKDVDFDAVFVRDEQGNVMIQKYKPKHIESRA